MEPMKLYFDVRDIFRAPRLALSGKKIWIFLAANVIGYAAYFILNYLGFALSGLSLVDTWHRYGLYPCMVGTESPWFAMVLFWVGSAVWFFAINLACTAVARVTYKQLKGDEFYSSGDAWKFVKKHWHPVIFTSVSLFLILVFFIAMAALFALFGKIPYLGEFLFVLPYILYFVGAIFTIYTAVVFVVSFIYTPAIIASLEEDTMGAVFNNYSITWSQPWRVVLYHGVLLSIGFLGLLIFKFFWLGGFRLVNHIFGHSALMGDKLANIVGTAAQVIWPERLLNAVTACCTHAVADIYSNHWFGHCLTGNTLEAYIPTASASVSGPELTAAVILGIFLFLITLSIFSYALSIFSVGEILMVTIFRLKTDDDNILKRKDEEELEAEESENGNLDFESDADTKETKPDSGSDSQDAGNEDDS